MGTAPNPAVSQGLSTDDKIDAAVKDAAAVVELFAPQAAAAIDAGVAVEPVLRGMAEMFIQLFRHHTKK